MTHVTCRLTAKDRDQLRNPTLGNRVWATFTFSTIAPARHHMALVSYKSLALPASSMQLSGVRHAATAGLLLWARRPGDIDRLLQGQRAGGQLL